MRNDLPFFSHDNNARLHPKMKALITQYGPAGYGRFWMLNERIAQADDARLDISKKITKLDIAGELHLGLDEFNAFIAFLSDPEIDLISAEESHSSAEESSKSFILTTDRTQLDYARVKSERERKKVNGRNSAEKRHSSAEESHSSAEFFNRAEQSRADKNRAGMQANSSSRDDDEIPDVADASMPPAACPFISTQEVKNACSLSPFGIRLSARDLEDIATRLSGECLDARFVAYVIRRAQEPGVKNPGAFARQALLGAGSFSQMPDEYRAEREAEAPETAEVEREPPPAICDECGAEVRHLPTAGESFCTNPDCGISWTWDAAFGWLKSEERAVPISDSGASWRKVVEEMERRTG